MIKLLIILLLLFGVISRIYCIPQVFNETISFNTTETPITTIKTVIPTIDSNDDGFIDSYCSDLSLDCEEREHLCSNSAFHEIMLERCPKTCKLCHELIFRPKIEVEEKQIIPQSRPISIEDYDNSNPIPDIDLVSHESIRPISRPPIDLEGEMLSLSQLVGSAERYLPDLETIDLIHERTKNSNKECRDLASDCHTKVELCGNLYYSRIMNRFCKKTCGYCDGKPSGSKRKQKMSKRKPKLILPKPKPITSNKTRSRGKIRNITSANTICSDLGIDCYEKRTLCGHKRYVKLMTRMCPKTCNYCES